MLISKITNAYRAKAKRGPHREELEMPSGAQPPWPGPPALFVASAPLLGRLPPLCAALPRRPGLWDSSGLAQHEPHRLPGLTQDPAARRDARRRLSPQPAGVSSTCLPRGAAPEPEPCRGPLCGALELGASLPERALRKREALAEPDVAALGRPDGSARGLQTAPGPGRGPGVGAGLAGAC